ncbi:RnfH family protein [Gynuella sunshinyii]|uniref:UPF0125 protein YC6258_05414 n=1 Tax=Gynuella sunshinyii YC6258 TaxID=1445510 RepID=A0A0C5W493_9GAMM|nr:RnfH family protein [Gynuella sunshinyii]AJQ97444.1 hypothetical protein YC6258_05414 [Gynuella sunshinyii YC6258]
MAEEFSIEVVYGTSQKQKIITVQVDAETTVFDAAVKSRIDREFPEIDFETQAMGIFGKRVAKPKDQRVQKGQRIELYRPLLIDPKQARANRAAKKARDEE